MFLYSPVQICKAQKSVRKKSVRERRWDPEAPPHIGLHMDVVSNSQVDGPQDPTVGDLQGHRVVSTDILDGSCDENAEGIAMFRTPLTTPTSASLGLTVRLFQVDMLGVPWKFVIFTTGKIPVLLLDNHGGSIPVFSTL